MIMKRKYKILTAIAMIPIVISAIIDIINELKVLFNVENV